MLKNQTPQKHQLQHAFTWPVPYDAEVIKDMQLIKGVAMSEGKLKSGEMMTRDNVVAGGGAMRASALMANAQLDIDHFGTELPEKYGEKYGKEILDPYPPGFIVDAQAVENKVGDSTLMQVEFIAVITNKKVYDMIKAGQIKGCSVVDYTRDLKCEEECHYEGSAYLSNTLILDEVPNSNGTWVAAVTHADIGTIIREIEKAEIESRRPGKLHALIQKHAVKKNNLENYMNDGVWNDGAESAIEYLKVEKEIDHDTATAMASYLMEFPTNVSQYQLENLSHADLMAWRGSTGAIYAKLRSMVNAIAELRWLQRDDVDLLKKAKNKLTPGQVNLRFSEKDEMDRQCSGCKWYVSESFAGEGEFGHCQMVAGKIDGNRTCDKYDKHVTKQCGCEAEPEDHADPEPVDGECPDGYMISEDGTKCAKPMAEQKEAVPEHKVEHAAIEKDPIQDQNLKIAGINGQISVLEERRKALNLQIRNMPQFNNMGGGMALEIGKINGEIKRLEDLKKKYI